MDTKARRRRAHLSVVDPGSDNYNHDLTLYNGKPTMDISLNEFEELALERVQLLRILEQASLKGHRYFSDEWKKCIRDDLIKSNLKKYARLMSGLGGHSEIDVQARRADYLSHWILKLAYCRSEDLRRWFLARELDWFKIKFVAQSSKSIQIFLESNNLNYTPISQEEKEELKEDLIDSTHGMTEALFIGADFYKVPFTDVCSLIKTRKVFLKVRYAYVPTAELVTCIQHQLRLSVSADLTKMSHKMLYYDDERINDFLCNLHNMHTGNEYAGSNNKEGINAADLDQLSKRDFPLCMRNMHETLRANHHLKHGARLTYGLFLKGIGLLYEQFVHFWREEFTKTMDGDKFNKNYLYNFNHQFGKVGRMTDYSPYSCVKIIMTNVGPGEVHGCPFKHFDPANLKAKMTEHGVSGEGINDILNLVKNGHYQVACTKYFEYVHSQPPVVTINHPNQYFEESRNITKNKAKKDNN